MSHIIAPSDSPSPAPFPDTFVIVTGPGFTMVASPWLPLVLLIVATVLSDVDQITLLVMSLHRGDRASRK